MSDTNKSQNTDITVDTSQNTKPIYNNFQVHHLKYLWAFLPLVLTSIGNILGGYFIVLAFLFIFALIPLDFILKSPTKIEIKDDKSLSNNILVGFAIAQILVTFSFLSNFISGSNNFGWLVPIAILTNGLAIGLAISAGAHELIHRREQNLKNIGTFQLALIGYGHHTVEHIQGHHRNIGYVSDPSSCAKGVSFYEFFWHGLGAEFQDAWKLEADRFTKKNLSPMTMNNQVFRWSVVSFVFGLFVLVSSFATGLLAYLLVSFIALGFHSGVVYSQHYGLVRGEGARVDDTLSWQTNSMITELFVLGFGNHSDHHTRVTKTYTEIVQKETGPLMPFGYFGVIPVMLIPKLWFKVVDPLIPKNKL